MSWEDEQEKLLVGPKLLALGAGVVFDELKKLSAKTKADRWWNNSGDKYEISLLHRNERLINLGLAAYGTDREVLAALYRHGLEPAQDEAEASYKEGLRIGCLSNSTAPEVRMLYRFPEEIIGKEETGRVLNAGTRNETTALIQNPQLSDRLLEALYTRSAPFAEIPEERWRELIWMSASNKRLVTEYEYEDMPDTGHYGIHKRIFALLAAAPLDYHWLRTVYHVLDQLDFQQVHSPERIDHVLGHWSQIQVPESKDDKDSTGYDGYYTALPIRDELRCFIAALYGRGYSGGKTILHGNRNASDIALRCAYYGKGELTVKDIAAGHEKDGGVFAFAATLNERIHKRRDLRKLMEDEYLHDDDMAGRWLKYDEQVRRKWPNSIPMASVELAVGSTNKPDTVQLSIVELQKSLATLTTRVSELRQLFITGAIILAALLIYFHWF